MAKDPKVNGFKCPSSPSHASEGLLFGVVLRDTTRNSVAYLKHTTPITENLLASVHPVRPEEVFRVAGQCVEKQCKHFDGAHCRLAHRIVEVLEPVVDSLPRCMIRPTCRWWAEQGASACFRCPSIITCDVSPSAELAEAANPEAKLKEPDPEVSPRII
jgi:hypothetical protein